MNGARDQLFARAGFAANQHGGIGRRDGFDLFEDTLQRRASADDLLEVQDGLDFLFEVKFLFVEFVFERFDFVVGERVFDGDGDLAGDLHKQFAIGLGECVLGFARHAHRADDAIFA
ncbi:MAG: hypothetical protein JMDDDDMK_00178 [Acidobacteria bacterium]|nr:hypothetical protein [Acidobacteriota bacterium]